MPDTDDMEVRPFAAFAADIEEGRESAAGVGDGGFRVEGEEDVATA